MVAVVYKVYLLLQLLTFVQADVMLRVQHLSLEDLSDPVLQKNFQEVCTEPYFKFALNSN
jgi:hypothetical protein